MNNSTEFNDDSKHFHKVGGGPPQMFMPQGVPMRGGSGMPMNNFGQGPNVLPGPLAFLEKTTSNIGKDSRW